MSGAELLRAMAGALVLLVCAVVFAFALGGLAAVGWLLVIVGGIVALAAVGHWLERAGL